MSPAIRTQDGLSLLQKAVIFFTVAVLLTLLLAVAVCFELAGGLVPNQVTVDTTEFTALAKSGDSLRNPMLLLTSFAGLFITLIIGLIFFIRNITMPLADIDRKTRRMTTGRFDQLIQVTNRDEIGRTGELINDLAINTQEVLLLFWNHTQQNSELITRLEKRVNCHPDEKDIMLEMVEFFTQLKQDNNDLKLLLLDYDFFNLKLEKGKILSNPQPE